MPIKKHNWVQYGRYGEIIELKLLDSSGHKIDFFRCNDEEQFRNVLRIVERKIGWKIRPEISKENSINRENELKKEKDWLEEDFKW